ncbi:MAG: hypothetical protein KDC54_02355, partial [Lewinella sp.]|nr:hypothetical protein [Lewinella sp.]
LAASAVASLRHLAGLIAFHNDQPQVALDFLTPLYQTSRPQIAHEIFHYAQFLHLLAHSEAGHTALVDHLSLNLRRQLGKDLAPAEGQLLRLIRQLLQAPDRQSVRELWAAWAAQLPAANDRLSLYLDLPFLAVRKGSS